MQHIRFLCKLFCIKIHVAVWRIVYDPNSKHHIPVNKKKKTYHGIIFTQLPYLQKKKKREREPSNLLINTISVIKQDSIITALAKFAHFPHMIYRKILLLKFYLKRLTIYFII